MTKSTKSHKEHAEDWMGSDAATPAARDKLTAAIAENGDQFDANEHLDDDDADVTDFLNFLMAMSAGEGSDGEEDADAA